MVQLRLLVVHQKKSTHWSALFLVLVNGTVLCIDPEKRKWVDFNGGEV